MKRVILFFVLLIALPSSVFADSAVENNFNLKAGLSYSSIFFKSNLLRYQDEDGEDDEDETNGFGINTSFGYRWTNWEFLVGSDILFGKLEDLTFQVNSTEIRGGGSFRIFSVTPMARYYTPFSIYNRWNFFVSAGPTWSLHTFIITNNLNGSDFNSKKRLNFENRGGSVYFGMEEIVSYKEMHPTFIEIGYSYMRSKQVFIVDASNFKDTRTLSRGSSKDFYGHYIVAHVGITLF